MECDLYLGTEQCRAMFLGGEQCEPNVKIGSQYYPYVKIGNRYWTTKNFAEPIGSNQVNYHTSSVQGGGLLYTWDAICKASDTPTSEVAAMLPSGWRVATAADYEALKTECSNTGRPVINFSGNSRGNSTLMNCPNGGYVEDDANNITWDNLKPSMVMGKYIKTNVGVGGTVDWKHPVSESGLGYIIADTTYNKRFRITGRGGDDPRLCCFVDADWKVLYVSDAYTTITGGTLNAPLHSRYVIFNSRESQVEGSFEYRNCARKDQQTNMAMLMSATSTSTNNCTRIALDDSTFNINASGGAALYRSVRFCKDV